MNVAFILIGRSCIGRLVGLEGRTVGLVVATCPWRVNVFEFCNNVFDYKLLTLQGSDTIFSFV